MTPALVQSLSAGGDVPRPPPVAYEKLRVREVSIEIEYQLRLYGDELSKICPPDHDPVPEAMYDEPPACLAYLTAPDAPFQSTGPKRKGGMLLSGELYTTKPPYCFAHVPDVPASSILTNACHGGGGA